MNSPYSSPCLEGKTLQLVFVFSIICSGIWLPLLPADCLTTAEQEEWINNVTAKGWKTPFYPPIFPCEHLGTHTADADFLRDEEQVFITQSGARLLAGIAKGDHIHIIEKRTDYDGYLVTNIQNQSGLVPSSIVKVPTAPTADALPNAMKKDTNSAVFAKSAKISHESLSPPATNDRTTSLSPSHSSGKAASYPLKATLYESETQPNSIHLVAEKRGAGDVLRKEPYRKQKILKKLQRTDEGADEAEAYRTMITTNFESLFVLTPLDYFTDASHHNVVFNYRPIDLVTLMTIMDERGVVSTSARNKYYWYLLAQVILGLEDIHTKLGLVHRDLKGDNLVMDEKGDMQIIDFGFSGPIGAKRPYGGTMMDKTPQELDAMLNLYDEKISLTIDIDVWEMGQLASDLLIGWRTYDIYKPQGDFTDKDVIDLYWRILYEKRYDAVGTEEEKDFIAQLQDYDPAKRLKNWHKIKQHSGFRKFGPNFWNMLRQRKYTAPILPVFAKQQQRELDERIIELVTHLHLPYTANGKMIAVYYNDFSIFAQKAMKADGVEPIAAPNSHPDSDSASLAPTPLLPSVPTPPLSSSSPSDLTMTPSMQRTHSHIHTSSRHSSISDRTSTSAHSATNTTASWMPSSTSTTPSSISSAVVASPAGEAPQDSQVLAHEVGLAKTILPLKPILKKAHTIPNQQGPQGNAPLEGQKPPSQAPSEAPSPPQKPSLPARPSKGARIPRRVVSDIVALRFLRQKSPNPIPELNRAEMYRLELDEGSGSDISTVSNTLGLNDVLETGKDKLSQCVPPLTSITNSIICYEELSPEWVVEKWEYSVESEAEWKQEEKEFGHYMQVMKQLANKHDAGMAVGKMFETLRGFRHSSNKSSPTNPKNTYQLLYQRPHVVDSLYALAGWLKNATRTVQGIGRAESLPEILEVAARFYLAEVLEGLMLLNHNGFIHRNMHPKSILINREGHAIISHTGFMKKAGGAYHAGGEFIEYRSPEAAHTELPKGIDPASGEPIIDPERKLHQGFSVDPWGLGHLLVTILAGPIDFFWLHSQASKPEKPDRPEDRENKTRVAVLTLSLKVDKYLDETLKGFSPDAIDLAKRLFKRSPDDRLRSPTATVEVLKKHPFFALYNAHPRIWDGIAQQLLVPPLTPDAFDPNTGLAINYHFNYGEELRMAAQQPIAH